MVALRDSAQLTKTDARPRGRKAPNPEEWVQ